MKTRVLLVALLAALAACSWGAGPRPNAATQEVFGFLTGYEIDDGQLLLKVELATLLSGEEAVKAARGEPDFEDAVGELGGSLWVVHHDGPPRSLAASDATEFAGSLLLAGDRGQIEMDGHVFLEAFDRVHIPGGIPVWITIDGSTVTSVAEHSPP